MKRSELVEELAKYLHNDWSITEGKDHRIPLVTADDIIDFLEKSGMLPPTRTLSEKNRNEYPELTNYTFNEFCLFEEVNTWEKE